MVWCDDAIDTTISECKWRSHHYGASGEWIWCIEAMRSTIFELVTQRNRYFFNVTLFVRKQIPLESMCSSQCRLNINWKTWIAFLICEIDKYVQNKAVLFTVDIPNSVEEMRCGQIDGVFATTDFGIDRAHEMKEIWSLLRQIQPNGPLVNSEMYPGWLTHWQEQNQRRDADAVAQTLK